MPHSVHPLEIVSPIMALVSFFLLIAVASHDNPRENSKTLNVIFLVSAILTGLVYCWLTMLGLGLFSPILAAIWLVVPFFLKLRRVI